MQTTLRIILTLAFTVLLGCCLIAQQPPAKTTPPAQPPAKTTPPDKNPPAKTMPPDKTAPGKTAPPGKTTAPATEPLVAHTFDGVRIEGDYYPAPEGKGKTTPVIILVHAVGNKHLNASRGDWGKLPEKLQKLGYAVAAIDMRGYGKSKTVEEAFWKTHRLKTRNRELIEAKDYTTSLDMLEMLYDLTAVKIWLNTKNNSRDCNSKAIGIIGLEQGGLIAMAWSANENMDPQRTKQRQPLVNNPQGNPGIGNPNQGNTGRSGFGLPGFGGGGLGFGNTGFRNNPNNNPNMNNPNMGGAGNQPGNTLASFEGEDIVCVLPISTTNRLNEPLSMGLMERWITFIRDRQVAITAIYGAQDKDANTFWSKAVQWAKPTTDKYRFKNNGTKPIKNTSLTGAKLLNNDALDVPKVLEEYLTETLKRAAESRLWAEQPGQDKPTAIELQRLLR